MDDPVNQDYFFKKKIKFRLRVGKFAGGVKAKHCWA